MSAVQVDIEFEIFSTILVFLGSMIIFRFWNDTFNTEYISTIGVDYKVKTVKVQDKKIRLQIWDSTGHDRFQTITSPYYR